MVKPLEGKTGAAKNEPGITRVVGINVEVVNSGKEVTIVNKLANDGKEVSVGKEVVNAEKKINVGSEVNVAKDARVIDMPGVTGGPQALPVVATPLDGTETDNHLLEGISGVSLEEASEFSSSIAAKFGQNVNEAMLFGSSLSGDGVAKAKSTVRAFGTFRHHFHSNDGLVIHAFLEPSLGFWNFSFVDRFFSYEASTWEYMIRCCLSRRITISEEDSGCLVSLVRLTLD